jgi:hypothetical protein
MLLGFTPLRDEIEVIAGVVIQHQKMGRMADLEGSDVSGVMVKLLADILYKRASRTDERWDALAPVSLERVDLKMA